MYAIRSYYVSRCQIFDFNRITIPGAVDHLKYVAQSENVEIEEEGLTVIAQKADGAMRDALSIFDRITSYNVCYTKLLRKHRNFIMMNLIPTQPIIIKYGVIKVMIS